MKMRYPMMIAVLLLTLGLAGCGGEAGTEAGGGSERAVEATESSLPDGGISTDASGTVEIDTAPADAAEQTADEWLKANGKEGYAVMARVMYPDHVEVMYTKAGEPNITLLVDAETGKVTGTK